MAIPDQFIQELKSRMSIEDVISEYVSLKRSGRSYMALCPFHNEKTPSFSVSPENGFFHCFGCGAGGDVITFIRKIENLDYVEAVKFLAKKVGMDVPENGRDDGMGKLKARIYEANREAARFYHKQLYSPAGKQALDYLRKRQLTEKTIIHFGLGYSPSSRFELINYLKSKGFSGSELITANLANQSQKGYPFDRFSDRVMFPIIDLRGNVIAFGGRIMTDIKPKYLNTSDTPVFNKSRNLYALQFAKNKANGQLILVEGYMDVIALHQAGFENAVATLGTSLTNEQALLMKRYCEEVVICYDADDAGQRATQRAIGILRPTGLRVKVLTVPNGKDPDEFIKSYGEQGSARFRMLLEKTGNDIDYEINKLKGQFNTDVIEQRVEFFNRAVPIIAEIQNSVERDVYITKLSEELNVEKSAVSHLVEQYTDKRKNKQRNEEQIRAAKELSAINDKMNKEKQFKLKAAAAEEALIAIMLINPDTAIKIVRIVDPTLFLTSFNRRIYEVLSERVKNGREIGIEDISSDFSVEEMGKITGIIISRPRENDPMGAAEEYIQVLENEKERLTPEQIRQSEPEEINDYIKKLRKKKDKR